jgi:hypothetical protein
LKAIAAVVRQELERNDLEQIQASAASLQSLLIMYYNGNHALLNPLIMKADDLAHQAAPFTYRSVGVFAVVGSMELTLLQEFYNHAKTAGNKKSIGIRAANLLAIGEKIPSELDTFNKSRFSPVVGHAREFGGHGEYDQPTLIVTYSYSLDGNWSSISVSDRETCERQRKQHIESEYKRLEKEILVPFYPVESKWKEIAEKNK